MNVLLAIVCLSASLLIHAGQRTSEPPVYIALGDSIAAGIGSSLPRERSYPAVLGGLLSDALATPVRTLNLSQPGESAESFLDSAQREELQALVEDIRDSGSNIEAVTLSLGGNELLEIQDASRADREDALASFETAFPAAVEAVRQLVGPETTIYVSTVYDPTGEDPQIEYSDAWWIERFNTVIRDAGTAGGTMVVDVALALGPDAGTLTRYPVDVHPTNEGHARIAAVHWAAMGIDSEPPRIEVLSDRIANRYTPTLRFIVSGDPKIASLDVRAGDEGVTVYRPVKVDEGIYAVLIDASLRRPESLDLTIQASDAAGNTAGAEVVLEFVISR